MANSFDSLEDAISFVDSLINPEGLQSYDFYSQLKELLGYVIYNAYEDLIDIRDKYRDPISAKNEAVSAIIDEYGFNYIEELASTLPNINQSILLQFISLLHLLKGTRPGLELILTILKFDFEIVEWWEETPQGEPMTFKMTLFINIGQVQDVFDTLERLREFVKNYVYPELAVSGVVFQLEFVDFTVGVAGFIDREAVLLIEDTI